MARRPRRPSTKRKGASLEPERKIEFVTSEATWLSLDVSARRHVDRFRAGGRPLQPADRRRPGHGHYDGHGLRQPARFSPDGKSIVFLSDRDGSENVWVANADGTEPRKLSRDQIDRLRVAHWSADGTYIIVSRQPGAPTRTSSGCTTRAGAGACRSPRPSRRPDTPGNRRLTRWVPSPHPTDDTSTTRAGLEASSTTRRFRLWQVARRDCDDRRR